MTHQIITTFGGALFFGIILIIISHKIKIPSIILLLIGGITIGPYGFGLIDPNSLGEGLKAIIQLAVALILFEGGLTLKVNEYRTLSSEIRNSLTIGVLVTWAGAALTIHYLFNFPAAFSILSASLIIVTGPTVIGPLIKRIGAKKNIHNFLHWEGILIDPIGVFIALLCYEWIVGENAIPLFLLRIGIGVAIGVITGYSLSSIIKKKLISNELLNTFILSSSLMIYIISDLFIPESGLMSVVVAGFVIGYLDTPQINSIKIYKAQLIELLIGLLFILLAANLDILSFKDHYGYEMIIAVIIIMVIVRPLNIFISTFKSKKFTIKDKLFLSWISPRGIVAASMASLYSLNLKESGSNYAIYAEFLEAFTYSIIVITIVFQGFSARWIGKLLKVLEPTPTGWLIIGAHSFAREIGKIIKEQGFDVVLIDTNIHSIKVAKREELIAIAENVLTIDPEDYPELYGIGNILAITQNENLNELVCQKLNQEFKKPNLFQWKSVTKNNNTNSNNENNIKTIWSHIPLEKIASIEKNKDIKTFTFENNLKKPNNSENVLLFIQNKNIHPYCPEEMNNDTYKCLIYSPETTELDFNIKSNWIVYSEKETITDTIYQLLEYLKKDYNKINIEKLYEDLSKREKEYSSYIGHNVALPHGYIDGIEESIVLMAKFKNSLKINESEEINFLFLVLSPIDQPNKHIKTLSQISKFVLVEKNINKLKEAKSKRDLDSLFFSGKTNKFMETSNSTSSFTDELLKKNSKIKDLFKNLIKKN